MAEEQETSLHSRRHATSISMALVPETLAKTSLVDYFYGFLVSISVSSLRLTRAATTPDLCRRKRNSLR